MKGKTIICLANLLDELTNKYIPAYGDLARVDIRSLERALTLRRMIIAKMQTPPDEASAAAHLKAFEEKGPEVQRDQGRKARERDNAPQRPDCVAGHERFEVRRETGKE